MAEVHSHEASAAHLGMPYRCDYFLLKGRQLAWLLQSEMHFSGELPKAKIESFLCEGGKTHLELVEESSVGGAP